MTNLRLPVVNIKGKQYVTHIQLALSNEQTLVTASYNVSKYNLLELTTIVARMVISSLTKRSTLSLNGYITKMLCHTIGKMNTSYVCPAQLIYQA